jgi:nucleoside-diphosphate-sugar epimerase
MNPPTGRIALFGAAGAIGRSIAVALDATGHPYRVVGRSGAALSGSYGHSPLAEVVIWDPDDPSSVEAAARGVHTIVYLVGVNYWQFELHPQLIRKTLDGAIRAGVERLVLIGTVYPYGRPTSRPVREDHPREPHTFKGRMRKAQEDLLLAADAAGQIQGTVLRLPDFYGPGVDKSFLHSAFSAAVTGDTANMIGPLDVPHEFVFVPDVGPVAVKLARTPGAYGRAWHLAGAGVTTQRELLTEIERQVGHPVKIRVAGKGMLRVLGIFDRFLREVVEMHYLLTDPVLMDDNALQRLIGPIPKTSYVEGVRRTLAALSTDARDSIGATRN